MIEVSQKRISNRKKVANMDSGSLLQLPDGAKEDVFEIRRNGFEAIARSFGAEDVDRRLACHQLRGNDGVGRLILLDLGFGNGALPDPAPERFERGVRWPSVE